MESFHEPLPATATQAEVLDAVDRWNADDRVDGILVQAPLPEGLDFKQVLDRIDPAKDVDGFHPLNVGRLVANQPALRPCTPERRDGAAGRLRRRRRPAPTRSSSAARTSSASRSRCCCSHQSATVTIAPLAHPRPAGGLPRGPTSWWPRSAGRG